MYHLHALRSPRPHLIRPPRRNCRHPHTRSAYTHATHATLHASQYLYPHGVLRQPRRQTKDDHITTDTPHGHRPSSRSEINLIILHVNINGIKNQIEEFSLLCTTHMQISLQLRKASSPLKQTHQTHQPECQTLHYNKYNYQISPRYLTHSTAGHHGQLSTHCHRTTCPSSSQLTYGMTNNNNIYVYTKT